MPDTTAHTFPNDPALVRLLIAAQQTADSHIMVHDVCGFEKTYPAILGDVIHMRHIIRSHLSAIKTNEHGSLCEERPYIAVISKSGYEFIVAFFAIRAMGGVCMPLSPDLSLDETSYFLRYTTASCFLVGRGCMRVVQDKIANHVEHGGQDLLALPIFCEAAPVSPSDISIDDAADLDPGGPGFVILTSGTTGRHKGVVLPRRSLIPTYVAEPNSATISYRPCFWVGGATNLIAPMVTGKKVYALRPNTTAQELLDTFKKHRITWLTFSPWVMKAMKDLLTDDDGFLSEERRQEYATWFQHLTRFRCSSGMPGRETVQFWAYLTGRPLENIYAGTEFGGAISVGETHLNGLDSIGFPVFNTVVKLTEGDHGELRVKSPFMMIRYVGDDKATQDAFDEEGFYKTGDLVDLRNGEYFMVGRMIDQIFFYSFRIPIMRVESNLQDLSYISEACVCAVPDRDATELCAAVVRLRDGNLAAQQSVLHRIRADLSEVLPAYMLPAIIRIMKDEEVVPKTQSGKIVRRFVAKRFFDNVDWQSLGIQPLGFQYFGNMAPESEVKNGA